MSVRWDLDWVQMHLPRWITKIGTWGGGGGWWGVGVGGGGDGWWWGWWGWGWWGVVGVGVVGWWGWDANILHWMEVKLCMDGGETIIMRPGCRWGRTWMDLKCTSWDLYGFEMGSACSWDIVIMICMELRRNLNEGETRILEPVFRWDSTWMEMRHTSSKLDWLRVMPGWNWHAVFRTGWRWYRPR